MSHFVRDGATRYLKALRTELDARVGELKGRLRREPAAREEITQEIESLRAAYREKERQAGQCLY